MTTTGNLSSVSELAEPRLAIDGALVPSANEGVFDNINPATEEVLGQTYDAAASDMDRAIAAARRAFDETSWSTDRAFRKRCLLQLHEALGRHRELLRSVVVAEVGSPVSLTRRVQLETPLNENLRWPAEMIDEFPWERDIGDSDQWGVHSWRRVLKEPVGVAGLIIPWNFPIETLLNKLGFALATGNTVVVKPAPDTPWNATHIGRIIAEETDFPPGVVNVVASSDHLRGEQLVDDPRVDMISFTGSTATGRRIRERAAATNKRLLLELGGKSAHIVLDDADFPSVLSRCGMGACAHSGQGCALLSRVLVPRARYAEAVELIAAGFADVPYGIPTDPKNIHGPLISAAQRERVLDYIRIGKDEGARLVLGGGRPAHLERGFYVEPTLFVDVEPTMRIAQEEIFGPVLTVLSYEDDDDAVRIANNSPYGLSGAVTTASTERGMQIARRIRTGSFAINGGVFHGADAPYGGYKASGLGRQTGLEGFEIHVETKTVAGTGSL